MEQLRIKQLEEERLREASEDSFIKTDSDLKSPKYTESENKQN